jgi:RNA polymerase sigma-70 factor (ECF subfamily)
LLHQGVDMRRFDPAILPTDSADPGPVSCVVNSRRGPAQDPMDLAMNRYADGDDTAFAELFAGLGPRLRGFLRRLTGSADLADDLLQETFLRMHAARGGFAKARPVLPWAYAIARNCYISHARSARTRMDRASQELTPEGPPAGAGTAEQHGIARQAAQAVERALQGMTAARREAFVMLRYEGLSVAMAAQIAGISEGALKIRAFHAYELIRLALAEQSQPRAPDDSAAPTGNQVDAAAYGA